METGHFFEAVGIFSRVSVGALDNHIRYGHFYFHTICNKEVRDGQKEIINAQGKADTSFSFHGKNYFPCPEWHYIGQTILQQG